LRRRNAHTTYNDVAASANQTTFRIACSFPSFRRESKQQVQNARPCRVSACFAHLQESVAEPVAFFSNGLWMRMTKELYLGESRLTTLAKPL